jgi:5,10-methylenetetrahydrofolate reductase
MYRARQFAVRHARLFEGLYQVLERILVALDPLWRKLGYERLDRPVAAVERTVKGFLFDCRMCGQCVLSSTGMSCPMNCPKELRNGPCGGVRPDGHCEVDPDMRCVWVDATEGAARMRNSKPGMTMVLAPVDHRLKGSSSWLRVAREKAGAPPAGGASVTSQTATRPGAPEVAARSASHLEQVLRRGDFAVTAELNPPDSADPGDVLRAAAPLRGIVDAINATEASGANCHISSVAIASILAREGLEAVMQVSCRDRNRIAIQGDVLGAAAIGVRNVLCLTGDGVGVGDQPEAKPVFDLDSVSLLETLRVMRDEARLRSGRSITTAPKLFLGAAENPCVPPYELRVQRLARKVAAGADFIQTNYVFDIELLQRFMARVRDSGLDRAVYILAGVGPLPSPRAARWLRAHVPGIHIPDALIERVEKAGKPQDEGKRICIELIQQIREIKGVAGIHLMAYRREHLIGEIVEESGILRHRRSLQEPIRLD